MVGAEMEKKSNCPHVKYLGFAGLQELLAQQVVKGSYTGPKSLIEDVSSSFCYRLHLHQSDYCLQLIIIL